MLILFSKGWYNMSEKKLKNIYDDDNIPEVDLPQNGTEDSVKSCGSVEPLPESSRPRKDGPGGN